jgi:hypothetical protein
MKAIWSISAAMLAVGAMLIAGCGEESTSKNTSSNNESQVADATDATAEGSTEVVDGANETDDSEQNFITLAEYEGFLPSDPVDSIELTEAEQEFASMSGGPHDESKKIELASFQFDAPVRIKAGDEFVKVETPGFACPTMADVDQDGKMDLVVGQFASGKMKLFRNIAADSDTPEFAEGVWIKTGDEIAEVPGVW